MDNHLGHLANRELGAVRALINLALLIVLITAIGSAVFLVWFSPAGAIVPVVEADFGPSGRMGDPSSTSADESNSAESLNAGTVGELSRVATDEEEAGIRFFGRVVDERRLPVVGANVTVGLGALGMFDAAELSGEGGEFSILLNKRPVVRRIAVVASTERAVGAMDVHVLPAASEVDAGTVVLLPASPLTVLVTRDGVPVAGAEVSIELENWRSVIASGETGMSGTVLFNQVPRGGFRLIARTDSHEGRERLLVPDQSEVRVELQERRSYVVRVSDLETDEPIAGAEVRLSESLWVPARSEPSMMIVGGYGTSWSTTTPIITNEVGLAHVRGVSSAARQQIWVQAKGYGSPPDRRGAIRLGEEQNVDVKLIKAQFTAVRWRVVDGEAPPPEDGVVVTLRKESGSNPGSEEEVISARMDGRWLVVDRIAEGGGYLATTDDGRIARPWVDRAAFGAADRGGVIEGKDISFRRARAITVRIRDPNGQPAPSALAVARNQGNNDLLKPVAADEDGVAVLGGLYGRLADVYVGPPRSSYPKTLVGSVELDEGSAVLDATLPSVMLARIGMTCDGEARLPPAFRVHVAGGCSVVSEDPAHGEVVVEIPNPTGPTLNFTVVSRDYLSGTGRLDVISASEARGAVALRSGGWFQVDVVRDPSARVEIGLEKQDPSAGSFGGARDRGAHGRLHRPNGPGDGFRFGPLSAGVYRAVDRRSGLVSDPVTVVSGNALSTVQLVINEPQWVTGTVSIPEGTSYRDVRVKVADPRSSTDVSDAGTRQSSVSVFDDGAFRIQVPGDYPVVVKPWHAWLQPTADGSLTTTLSQSDVVLRLAEGREVRIRAPDLVGATLRDLRVGFWRGAIINAPDEWIRAVLDGDQIRFVPPESGACALMIDPGSGWAPVRLPGVVLEEKVTELGPVSFGPGTTLLVRVLTAPGADPPRISLGASRSEEPSYSRWTNSGGERVVKLPGLAAGHFKVRITTIMDVNAAETREVDVDGLSDLELIYDLR